MQVIQKDLHATRLRVSAARVWRGYGRGQGWQGLCSRLSGSSITVESLIPALTPQVPITNTLPQVNALIDEEFISRVEASARRRDALIISEHAVPTSKTQVISSPIAELTAMYVS